MLKSLKYSVEFPNGKALSSDIEFESGMTAISGKNEAGKSMVLEMIRFGLFGTAALRGKSSDYKNLSMELTFKVRGDEYVVSRTRSKAELKNADGPVASGVTPVNQHIANLFGYDLAVFDTANNCAQGEIERLGSMRPTERKALVDQTVGLTALDELISWAGEELAGERKAYEALSGVLIEPEKPEAPLDYEPSSKLKPELEQVTALCVELNQLDGWLSNATTRSAPTPPGPAPSSFSVEELKAHEARREENDRLRMQLQAQLDQLLETTATQEEVDEGFAACAHNAKVEERQQLEALYPLPPLTSQQIEDADHAHSALSIVKEIERLEKNGRVTCPACGTDFAHEHKTLVTLNAELLALEPYDLGLAHQYPRRDLDRFMNQLEGRRGVQAQIDALPTERVEEKHSESNLQLMQQALNSRAHAASLRESLAGIEVLPNKRDELVAMTTWARESAMHIEAMKAWREFERELGCKRARQAELNAANVVVQLQDLTARHQQAVVYEAEKANYDRLYAAYSKNKLVADQHKERMDDLGKARKALRELKVRVKGYLLPSLNRVASALLSSMTGGERNTVLIDEDFEITVDDQPLSTLSGSGKAVANLAIRLGLGQVLTNKVFSVFMADEIDAAMDQSRAGFTAECLSRLTTNIGQVILVSHKTINASHHIVVGSTSNESPESFEFSEGAH